DQDLARRARRGAVDEALTGRDAPRECSPDRATDRRAARFQGAGPHHRDDRQRPHAAVRVRLPALAVRGRRHSAAWAVGRSAAAHPRGQPAGDLSSPEGDSAMNAPVDVMERRSEADARLGIIDCDIHPSLKPGALNQYLSARWRKHLAEYGKFNCGIYADRGT